MKPILDNMDYVREVEKARAEAIAYNKSHTKTDQTKGREVLAVGVDHGTWVSRAKHEYPSGSLWVAKTATVYGPARAA
ncbi:hypothetical protein [Brucella sp. BZ]|uniref:hypothetical protein n=1 Tax=Brucella sp. BZ TaxID=3381346 RepID=UPI0039ECC1F7